MEEATRRVRQLAPGPAGKPSRTSLAALAPEVAKICEPALAERGVSVAFALDPDLPEVEIREARDWPRSVIWTMLWCTSLAAIRASSRNMLTKSAESENCCPGRSARGRHLRAQPVLSGRMQRLPELRRAPGLHAGRIVRRRSLRQHPLPCRCSVCSQGTCLALLQPPGQDAGTYAPLVGKAAGCSCTSSGGLFTAAALLAAPMLRRVRPRCREGRGNPR